MIREYKDGDLIRSLREQSFPIPDLSNPLYNEIHTVESEKGRIVGVGALKLTCEAIIMLDHNLPILTRAKAVEELIQLGIMKCQKHGLDEMHAFLTGPASSTFADLLKEKFAFERIVGEPLVLRL